MDLYHFPARRQQKPGPWKTGDPGYLEVHSSLTGVSSLFPNAPHLPGEPKIAWGWHYPIRYSKYSVFYPYEDQDKAKKYDPKHTVLLPR